MLAFIALLTLMLLGSGTCLAKAELKDRYACEWIIIATYSGLREDEEVSEDQARDLVVRDIKVVKGPSCSVDELYIHSDFPKSVKVNKIAALAGKYKKGSIPPVGSRWILFITAINGMADGMKTFDGSKGWVEYNRKNLDEVFDAMARASGHRTTKLYRDTMFELLFR